MASKPLNFEQNQKMTDPYLDNQLCIDRMVENWKSHKSLLVAFDFDNTVFDYHQKGYQFPKVEKVLKRARKLGCQLILFTANEGEKLERAVSYCTTNGYPPDYINESPVSSTRKPYVSILLDDRAGLSAAYEILNGALDVIELKNSGSEL